MSKINDKSEELENMKREFNITEQHIEEVNILFLDVSSTCTGYSVASINFTNKRVTWKSAGALWLDPKWSHQEKYVYISRAILDYFYIVESIDYIITEQYSINPKKMSGIHVVPEMQGAIKAAAGEQNIQVASILPQTWRSQLSIKKKKLSNGKSDYKSPTMDRINEFVEVPDKSISNITTKERTTPSDLYDSLGVGLGWLKKVGFNTGDFSNIKFNPHIGFKLGK